MACLQSPSSICASGGTLRGRLQLAPCLRHNRAAVQQCEAAVCNGVQQQQQRRQQQQQCRTLTVLRVSSRDDVQPVPDLPAPTSDLVSDSQWIAGLITAWLDDEWTPLEVHRDLGQAAGAAYVTCRRNGDDDMSSLVIGISSELLSFNYRETFVNAFEVANKVVEVLMMREGVPVCCVSQDDVERFERFSSSGSSSGSQSSTDE